MVVEEGEQVVAEPIVDYVLLVDPSDPLSLLPPRGRAGSARQSTLDLVLDQMTQAASAGSTTALSWGGVGLTSAQILEGRERQGAASPVLQALGTDPVTRAAAARRALSRLATIPGGRRALWGLRQGSVRLLTAADLLSLLEGPGMTIPLSIRAVVHPQYGAVPLTP